MKSVIDVIHSVFEVDLGPDLISDLDRIDHKLLFRFRESYAAFANSSVLPTKDQTELRPLATYRALGYTEHLRIDGFLNELDKPALQEDEVKKHLLYCHSLVLDDPLPFILDHFSGRGASGKSRARLASYFAFLNHVKPVVEENILSFVDLLKHRPD